VSWIIREGYLPTTAFGACFKCRAAQRPGERVLDPNLVTDDLPPHIVPGGQDGYLMFCESCITEAAQMLDMQKPIQIATLVEDLADAVAANERLFDRLSQAESALAALRKYDAAQVPE